MSVLSLETNCVTVVMCSMYMLIVFVLLECKSHSLQ